MTRDIAAEEFEKHELDFIWTIGTSNWQCFDYRSLEQWPHRASTRRAPRQPFNITSFLRSSLALG